MRYRLYVHASVVASELFELQKCCHAYSFSCRWRNGRYRYITANNVDTPDIYQTWTVYGL